MAQTPEEFLSPEDPLRSAPPPRRQRRPEHDATRARTDLGTPAPFGSGWSLPPALDATYELLDRVAQNSTTAVFRIRHRLLDQVRALKIVQAPTERAPAVAQRFLREARNAARVRHPSLVEIHDFGLLPDPCVEDGSENGQRYLIMEHIDGATLRTLAQLDLDPPVPLVVEIARQSLEALEALHTRGLAHRDVSPDNLMLTRDEDGAPRVKLLDLGLATEFGPDPDAAAGVFVGKSRYAAPERVASTDDASGAPIPAARARVDPRSDLYSWAVVLHELLTGRHPTDAPSPASEAPSSRSQDESEKTRLQLRDGLLLFVHCCLARNPAHRPGRASEGISYLDDLVRGTSRSQWLASLAPEVKTLLERAGSPGRRADGCASSDDTRLHADLGALTPSCEPELLLDIAERALHDGQPGLARRAAAEALDVDPYLDNARRLLKVAIARADQDARERALARCLSEIEALLLHGHLGRGWAELEAARLRWGQDERLEHLETCFEHMALHRAANGELEPLPLPPTKPDESGAEILSPLPEEITQPTEALSIEEAVEQIFEDPAQETSTEQAEPTQEIEQTQTQPAQQTESADASSDASSPDLQPESPDEAAVEAHRHESSSEPPLARVVGAARSDGELDGASGRAQGHEPAADSRTALSEGSSGPSETTDPSDLLRQVPWLLARARESVVDLLREGRVDQAWSVLEAIRGQIGWTAELADIHHQIEAWRDSHGGDTPDSRA